MFLGGCKLNNILTLYAESWALLFKGLQMTIFLSVITLVLAFIFGILFALMGLSKNKFLRAFYTGYVYFVRGIPVMIFALFLFFGVGALLQIKFNPAIAAIITLTINATAYLAEIFRGGIQAVPKGQVEAARSLGLGYTKTLRRVVLPQAIKIMIPPIINQFISTIKDTSILMVISVRELTMNSQIIIARTYQPFEIYALAGLMYLVVIVALSLLAKYVERRTQYDRRS